MRVLVRIGPGRRGRECTYEAPEGTQVGDAVEVPLRPGEIGPLRGEVTALGSDYEGDVQRVLRVLPRLGSARP